MDINVDFPGGLKVDAHFNGFNLCSDQPLEVGGENSAPSPYLIFLASIGCCAGYYILSFCKKHEINTKGIHIIEHVKINENSHLAEVIQIEIQVPQDFPTKYNDALLRIADQCKVKQSIVTPPLFSTFVKAID